jgi:hypothetical protein
MMVFFQVQVRNSFSSNSGLDADENLEAYEQSDYGSESEDGADLDS